MDLSSGESITRWIEHLKRGDNEAARRIWNQYFDRLCLLARRKLVGTPSGPRDEEDVAVSVFDLLCRGAAEGRFPELTDRDELWRLLAAITVQKAIDQRRHAGRIKRGGQPDDAEGATRRTESLSGLDQLTTDEPTPEFVAIMNEEHQRLLGKLRNDTLRLIACRRMEGYSNEELAAELHVSVRTIERKLNLIRHHWSEEISW